MLNHDQLLDYQAQCNLLYHCLYFAPSAELLTQLREGDIRQGWPQTGEILQREQGLALLASAFDDSELLQSATREHMTLFIGPGELAAIPWGSPYLHEKRLLCGPSTLELQRFYEHHGIKISTDTNEPVDHIGLMLSAVSALLAEEAQRGDGAALNAVKVLLAEHLLPWSGRYLELFANTAAGDYYRGLGLLTASVLDGLQEDLQLTPLKLQLFQ